MSTDKIIAEVWQHRDAYAAEHHHSLEEMVADLMRRQRSHAKCLVDRRSGRRSQPAARSAYPDAASQPARVVAEGRPKYKVRGRTPPRAAPRAKH